MTTRKADQLSVSIGVAVRTTMIVHEPFLLDAQLPDLLGIPFLSSRFVSCDIVIGMQVEPKFDRRVYAGDYGDAA